MTGPLGASDHRLDEHTSLRVGGPADFYVRARSEDDLLGAIKVARTHELPVFILGGGTNLLVSDRGIRGVVLHNGWSETQVDGTTVTAASGTPLASVAAVAARSGIAGLEWMATVPGTVGGAVHGNAGAFGSDTSEALVDATLVDLNGDVWTQDRASLGYSYRTSALQGTPIVCLRARFRGVSGDRAVAVAKIKEMANQRIAKQPLAQPNTGSIFRNPEGDHAGRLIEAAGLKGVRIGGAQVSEKHANFIVNTGGATAAEVWALMQRCISEVRGRFSIELVPEVERVGEW